MRKQGARRLIRRKSLAVIVGIAAVLGCIGNASSENRMTRSIAAQVVTLDQVRAVSGISQIRTGVAVTAYRDTTSGVYFLQASDCVDARQDSFEIVFDRQIEHIFGLGSKRPEDKPELSDFRDEHFSVGHYNHPNQPWEPDTARMRTPIFVLPTEGLIVAYMQPRVKKVELARTSDSTTIFMGKHDGYIEGNCEPFVIVKGDDNSIADAYGKLYTYLTAVYTAFKRPHWNAFGLGWETFPAIGCDTSLPKVQTAYASYTENEVKLSFLIIGSGYWNSNNITGCGASTHKDVEDPTMDALAVNPNFTSTDALDEFFGLLSSQGVYPMLGMRHTIPPRNVARIQALLQPAGQVYLDENIYYGGEPSNNVRMLNVGSEAVIGAYIDRLHAAYGSFKGIKEDEMVIGDQKAYAETLDISPDDMQNLPDGTVRNVYGIYTRKHDGDFIVDGRNDWFSVMTDIQNGPGYIPNRVPSGYYLKDEIDAALTMVMSGYPHPKIELHRPQNGDQLEVYRGIQALTFMPATSQSVNFTNLSDPEMRAAAIYFSKLRNVLHQYAFDHAQNWHATGVPGLMRPLYIDYPQDERVYDLYNGPVGPARNQYMMGNALLVRPIFNGADSLPTYLPAGRWKPLLKDAPSLAGNRQITYSLQDLRDFPVFVKEGEIFLMGTESNSTELSANVFLEQVTSSSEYIVHEQDGSIMMRLKAEKEGANIVFVNSAIGRRAPGVVGDNGFYSVPIGDLAPDDPPTATPTATPTSEPPAPSATPLPSTRPRAWLPLLSNGQAGAAR